jgi:hypothetical protein
LDGHVLILSQLGCYSNKKPPAADTDERLGEPGGGLAYTLDFDV